MGDVAAISNKKLSVVGVFDAHDLTSIVKIIRPRDYVTIAVRIYLSNKEQSISKQSVIRQSNTVISYSLMIADGLCKIAMPCC